MKYLFSLFFIVNVFCLNAQSVDEIIQMHIDAIGGLDAWDKIKTIEIKTDIDNNGFQIESIKSISKRIDFRNDYTYIGRQQGIPNLFHDKKYYIIVSSDGAWKYMPENKNNDIIPLENNEAIIYMEDFDYEDPFIHYKNKENEIKMLPIEYINDVEYYKFYIKFLSGREEYCYINSKTNLIYKRVLINSEIESTKEFIEYQTLPIGIIFPKIYKTDFSENIIKSVKINIPFSKTFFKPNFNPRNNYKQ